MKKEIGAPAVIVRDRARSAKEFFRDHDKGSARPAFCYPSSVRAFKEEASKLEKLFRDRMVHPTREVELSEKLRSMKQRISEIDKQAAEVKKEMKADPDYWDGRRKELAEMIKEYTPSKSTRKKKLVSPREILSREKGTKGKLPKLEHGGDSMSLEEAKKEYMIISRAMDEESNISYIEKE